MDIETEYRKWLEQATDDNDLIRELKTMDEKTKQDAFYRDFAFGTGGLRGTIGVGTNRMNIYTVRKATKGIADYILDHVEKNDRKVAISFDSRIKSDLFAKTVAEVFASCGIHAYIYPTLSPVPTLSYATRYLKCAFGIMITASHNPSAYNGYKVYGKDGYQITDNMADTLLSYIEKVDPFDIRPLTFAEGFRKNLISYITPDVLENYIKEVRKQSLIKNGTLNRSASIIYTPLNGTGLVPVKEVLKEEGYSDITVVREQEFPNGYFPTCPYPNPEIKEAMTLGILYAENRKADLLIATDPDCDRVGIAVKGKDGQFTLLSGNETFLLLFDYICQRRGGNHTMPKDPLLIKTIVSTDLAEEVAKHYQVKVKNVLTGFKYIGEQIGELEKKGEADRFIFGFEESYGCLAGTYVRDKDAVVGTMLVAEMFSYYRQKGISLINQLETLYRTYGYQKNTLYSHTFLGQTGFKTMQNLMEKFRKEGIHIEGRKTISCIDYQNGIDGLPKSNVLKFTFDDKSTLIIRPSGTEPKLKMYLSVKGASKEECERKEAHLSQEAKKALNTED